MEFSLIAEDSSQVAWFPSPPGPLEQSLAFIKIR